MAGIKFGTDGWRAVISDQFTFDNVKLVSQAIADYIRAKEQKSKRAKGNSDGIAIPQNMANSNSPATNNLNVFFINPPFFCSGETCPASAGCKFAKIVA